MKVIIISFKIDENTFQKLLDLIYKELHQNYRITGVCGLRGAHAVLFLFFIRVRGVVLRPALL